MSILRALSSILSSIERTIVVVLLTFMIGLAFFQVILRNFFDTGFLWADPLLRHLVLWVGFLGASLATQTEKHINLDIIQRLVSPRALHYIRMTASLFAAVVTAYLARAGWVFLESEREVAEVVFTIGQTPVQAWWLQMIIPIGFGLLALRFLLKAIETSARIFGHEEPVEQHLPVPPI